MRNDLTQFEPSDHMSGHGVDDLVMGNEVEPLAAKLQATTAKFEV